MKKRYVILIILIICLAYSACIPEFVNSLTEPQNAEVDKKLLGTWFTEDGKEKAYIDFRIDKKDSKLLNAEIKAIDKENKIEMMFFSLFVTTTKDETFMNIRENKEGKLNDFYYIMKYEVKNNKLKIFTINEKKLEKALENNKILGISKKGIFHNIKITDMGLNTLNLLENDELFVLFAEFQKVK